MLIVEHSPKSFNPEKFGILCKSELLEIATRFEFQAKTAMVK